MGKRPVAERDTDNSTHRLLIVILLQCVSDGDSSVLFVIISSVLNLKEAGIFKPCSPIIFCNVRSLMCSNILHSLLHVTVPLSRKKHVKCIETGL